MRSSRMGAFLAVMTCFFLLNALPVGTLGQPEESTNDWNFTGHIYIMDTDEPISGAEVFVFNDFTEQETTTLDDGSFGFLLRPGEYVVEVFAQDFYELEDDFEVEQDAVTELDLFLEPEEEKEEGNLIEGWVFVEGEDEPIEGAVVELWWLEAQENEEFQEGRAETDEEGYFEFTDLPEGYYGMHVVKEGFELEHREVEVFDDEVTLIEVGLFPQGSREGSFVEGVVLNGKGDEPIWAGIEIESLGDRPGLYQTRTNDDGWFGIDVPPGKYKVHITSEGFHPFEDTFEIGEGNELFLGEIFLEPEFFEFPLISGTVFDAKSNCPIPATVHLILEENLFFDDRDRDNWEENSDEFKWEDEWDEKEGWEDEWDEKEGWEDEWDEKEEWDEEEWDEKDENKEEKDEDGNTRCDKKVEKNPCERPCDQPNDKFIFHTDCGGFFEIWVLPHGHYQMIVEAPGHSKYYNEVDIFGEPLYLNIYLQNVPHKKPEWRVVEGQVLDAVTKEPIVGALLSVMPLDNVRKDVTQRDVKVDESDVPRDQDKQTRDPVDPNAVNSRPTRNDEDGNGERERQRPSQGEGSTDDPASNERPTDDAPDDRPTDDQDYDPDGKPIKKDDKNIKDGKGKEGANKDNKMKKGTDEPIFKTDEKGYFKMELPAGDYVLVVKARGYEPTRQVVHVSHDEKVTKTRFAMEPSDGMKDGRDLEGEKVASIGDQVSDGGVGAHAQEIALVVVVLAIILILAGIMMTRKKKSAADEKDESLEKKTDPISEPRLVRPTRHPLKPKANKLGTIKQLPRGNSNI